MGEMTDTETRELCAELYELTGWEDTEKVFRYDGKEFTPSIRHPEIDSPDLVVFYDTDYLLRKLPHFIQLTQLSGGYTPNGWRAEKNVSQEFPGHYKADADTPQKALLKLSLELAKQGLIQ